MVHNPLYPWNLCTFNPVASVIDNPLYPWNLYTFYLVAYVMDNPWNLYTFNPVASVVDNSLNRWNSYIITIMGTREIWGRGEGSTLPIYYKSLLVQVSEREEAITPSYNGYHGFMVHRD